MDIVELDVLGVVLRWTNTEHSGGCRNTLSRFMLHVLIGNLACMNTLLTITRMVQIQNVCYDNHWFSNATIDQS